MTDIVARQQELSSVENTEHQRGPNRNPAADQPLNNNDSHNHQQETQSNESTVQIATNSLELKQIRLQEEEIIEELRRLGRSCQSNAKPSMSLIRADLERISRKLKESS